MKENENHTFSIMLIYDDIFTPQKIHKNVWICCIHLSIPANYKFSYYHYLCCVITLIHLNNIDLIFSSTRGRLCNIDKTIPLIFLKCFHSVIFVVFACYTVYVVCISRYVKCESVKKCKHIYSLILSVILLNIFSLHHCRHHFLL